MKSFETRFWNKVHKTMRCWIWIGSVNSDGYGQIKIGKKGKKAHRVAYEITAGKIPKGMCVCHTCDNPTCVRPAHLFLGTHHDNMEDMVKKGRAKANKLRGESHYRATLTTKQVIEIRHLYSLGELTQTDLAIMFNSTQVTISDIIRYKSWSHI